MQNVQPYILTGLSVLSITAGQLLFKLTASKLAGRPILGAVTDSSIFGPLGLAICIYGIATVLWIFALRDLALSSAYMFMAVSFVLVPIGSALFFSEHLSLGFLVGLGLIVAGLVVTQVFN